MVDKSKPFLWLRHHCGGTTSQWSSMISPIFEGRLFERIQVDIYKIRVKKPESVLRLPHFTAFFTTQLDGKQSRGDFTDPNVRISLMIASGNTWIYRVTEWEHRHLTWLLMVNTSFINHYWVTWLVSFLPMKQPGDTGRASDFSRKRTSPANWYNKQVYHPDANQSSRLFQWSKSISSFLWTMFLGKTMQRHGVNCSHDIIVHSSCLWVSPRFGPTHISNIPTGCWLNRITLNHSFCWQNRLNHVKSQKYVL